MTDTTIGSWCGRTLRVIHAPGARTRWRLETSPPARRVFPIFHGWLRTHWPALTGFFYSLNLAEERKLMAAVARLIYKCDDASKASAWLSEAVNLSPDCRLLYIEAVLPHARRENAPFELLREIQPGPGYREALGDILQAYAAGLPLALIRDTITYAAATHIGIDWEAASPTSVFDKTRALELLARAESLDDGHLCRQLWRTMVRRHGARKILAAKVWDKLDPAELRTFLDLALEEVNREQTPLADTEARLARMLYTYRKLDEAQRERARSLPYRFLRNLPIFWPVVDRLPAGVVPEKVSYFDALEPFEALPAAARGRYAEAPAQSFAVMLKALERRNDCELRRQGLITLFQALPGRMVEAFRVAPKHLMQLARLVGALHENHGLELLRTEGRHELCTAEIADEDVVALDNLLGRHVVLARRLRRFHEWELHFSGRKLMPLSGVQLAFAELRAQIALLAVWQLEEAVKAHLAFDPHTYALLRQSEPNHRVLRRLLRRPHLDFIDAHPATVAWRRRFPQVNVERWRQGVVLERDGVRLALERDPREVLKMGTYVGSCLGLGGHNMFNAATVLLDVNKQVVFARDGRGKFVARQLLALSEEGKLVCFPVYAGADRRHWEPLFADYARALAWTLGLAIHTQGDYKIPQVIARGWYDDGHWDLVPDDERVAA